MRIFQSVTTATDTTTIHASSTTICGSDERRVHFDAPESPATKSRMSILASLKNTYSGRNSPVKSTAGGTSSGSGLLSKLHEKLAATRSSPSPLSSLDVPKLRDLKSHSFPPPAAAAAATNDSINAVDEGQDTNDGSNQVMNDYSTANYASSPSSYLLSSRLQQSLESSSYCNYESSSASTGERRKRWLMYNHSVLSTNHDSG